MSPTWTKEPKEDGEYVCRHFWADGTQSGHDYLYRLAGEKWVNLIGEPDKRQHGYAENERMWYFGPIPPLPHARVAPHVPSDEVPE